MSLFYNEAVVAILRRRKIWIEKAVFYLFLDKIIKLAYIAYDI